MALVAIETLKHVGDNSMFDAPCTRVEVSTASDEGVKGGLDTAVVYEVETETSSGS